MRAYRWRRAWAIWSGVIGILLRRQAPTLAGTGRGGLGRVVRVEFRHRRDGGPGGPGEPGVDRDGLGTSIGTDIRVYGRPAPVRLVARLRVGALPHAERLVPIGSVGVLRGGSGVGVDHSVLLTGQAPTLGGYGAVVQRLFIDTSNIIIPII
jgi:hypothetical protein